MLKPEKGRSTLKTASKSEMNVFKLDVSPLIGLGIPEYPVADKLNESIEDLGS